MVPYTIFISVALEQAEHLKRRKEFYEAKYPGRRGMEQWAAGARNEDLKTAK